MLSGEAASEHGQLKKKRNNTCMVTLYQGDLDGDKEVTFFFELEILPIRPQL